VISSLLSNVYLYYAFDLRAYRYAGTIEAGVEIAGRQLFERAVRAGFGADSRIHAVR